MVTKRYQGFTIVELLIVIVVIGILAAIIIIAYLGIMNRAMEASLTSDLKNASKQLEVSKTTNGSYPSDTGGIKKSNDTVFQYTYNNANNTFCLTATNTKLAGKLISISETGVIQQTGCSGHVINPSKDGDFIQTVTSATCSTGRIRAVDARDNHTYWVQKMADGKCWMLTNLAYAGGGTNTYADVKTLTNGTASAQTYTVPSYYVVPGTTNYTTEPTAPTAQTDGNGQYGYFYNWCGAMGGQVTGACANSMTPTPNTTISICPAGWRLPVSNNNTSEFDPLNTAINGGLMTTDAGWLTGWLSQRGGFWNNGTFYTGSNGYFWGSSQDSSASNAFMLTLRSDQYSRNAVIGKAWAIAMRCVAN